MSMYANLAVTAILSRSSIHPHYQFQADNLIRWVWSTSYKSLYHETKIVSLYSTPGISRSLSGSNLNEILPQKMSCEISTKLMCSDRTLRCYQNHCDSCVARKRKPIHQASGPKCRPNGYDEHMPPCHTMAAYYYRAVCITTQLITVDSCGFCRWWKQELHNSIEWLHPLP